jgi:hypothetical protein
VCGEHYALQVYRELLFILYIMLLRKQTPTLVITQSATQNRVVSSTINLSRSLKLRVKKENLNDILTSLEHLPTVATVGDTRVRRTYNNNNNNII